MKRASPIIGLIATDLQRTHLKTDFSNIILAGTIVWQNLQNNQSISGILKEKASKTHSFTGQSLIVSNHVQTGLKVTLLCIKERYHILISWSTLVTKGMSSFENVDMRIRFNVLIIKQSQQLIYGLQKFKGTVKSHNNIKLYQK